MKICPIISNSKPAKFVKSLYYANKPMQMYKPEPQRPAFLKKENKFINFLRKLF